MEIKIRALTSNEDDEVYRRVAFLFFELHQHMNQMGLTQKLVPEGEMLWINAAKKMLGKLNAIIVASDEDKIIGFSVGNIRLSPSYLGSKKIGYWTHVYICEGYKSQKVGQKLYAEMENWFNEREVDYIEGDVQFDNINSQEYLKKLGFKMDYMKVIKTK